VLDGAPFQFGHTHTFNAVNDHESTIGDLERAVTSDEKSTCPWGVDETREMQDTGDGRCERRRRCETGDGRRKTRETGRRTGDRRRGCGRQRKRYPDVTSMNLGHACDRVVYSTVRSPTSTEQRSMSPTLELNCLVLGDVSSRVFTVKIANTENVSALKKLIKVEKKPAFDHVPADTLDLWKVGSLYSGTCVQPYFC
jgi:hypothetical protein